MSGDASPIASVTQAGCEVAMDISTSQRDSDPGHLNAFRQAPYARFQKFKKGWAGAL
jgi:hypothetical protein